MTAAHRSILSVCLPEAGAWNHVVHTSMKCGLAAMMLAVGCGPAEPTVECTLGEPVRIGPALGATHQIALLDGALLWTQNSGDGWWSQWVDAETGAPLGEPQYMGYWPGSRPVWVRDGDRLLGILQSDLEARRLSEADPTQLYAIWEARPPDVFVRRPLDIDVPDGCHTCVGGELTPHGAFSAVTVSGRLMGVISVTRPECVGTYLRPLTLRLVDLASGAVQPVVWEERCAFSATDTHDADVPWAVGLSDGTIGVLFGVTARDQPFQYLVTSMEGDVLEGPHFVGSGVELSSIARFPQSRAARVGDRVLFVERPEIGDECFRLRVMNEDGSDPRDAAWQPSCGILGWYQLQSMGEHVLLTYSNTSPLTAAAERFTAAVVAAVLDRDGALRSEIVTVSVAEAGPTAEPTANHLVTMPSSLWVSPAGEAFVSYASRTSGAEGLFVRRVRCRDSN